MSKAFVLNLFGALAVAALAACGQLRGAPLTANDAQWTADAHWRQVDLDVEAIINAAWHRRTGSERWRGSRRRNQYADTTTRSPRRGGRKRQGTGTLGLLPGALNLDRCNRPATRLAHLALGDAIPFGRLAG